MRRWNHPETETTPPNSTKKKAQEQAEDEEWTRDHSSTCLRQNRHDDYDVPGQEAYPVSGDHL